MKDILKEFTMPGLTCKQKAIVWYFGISFCLITSVADASIGVLVILVLNFANSARLIKKVPIPKEWED